MNNHINDSAPEKEMIDSAPEKEMIDSAPEKEMIDSAPEKEMIKIITDEPTLDDFLDFSSYAKRLADLIVNSKTRFSIGIFGEWGTGKTSLMKMIKNELELYNKTDKTGKTSLMKTIKNELDSNDIGNTKILTVWFDAWKFEKEKYLAVIPLVRTIRIAVENYFTSRRYSFTSRKLRTLRNGLNRTFAAFTAATQLNLGLEHGSIQTDLSKFLNVLKADGEVTMDNETVHYHPHVTDHLAAALTNVRKEIPDFRIVVFIDDLDRCMPEKALEVLESIKIFFDIEGIVFVIGMDPNTIDDIISIKYGNRKNVSGQDYIEKIVQLPFNIPDWTEIDISKFVEHIINNDFKDTVYEKEFKASRHLLINSIERNPRQVKRFINTIILAKSVFNKAVEKLIVVQALTFRSEWKRFLEFITPDDNRKFFLEEYKKLKSMGNTIDNLLKNMQDKYPSFADLFDGTRSIFKNDDFLIKFLDAGAAYILSDIEKMEEYRRALDTSVLVKDTSIPVKDDVSKKHNFQKEILPPIWFSNIENRKTIKSGSLKWTDSKVLWDWDNCYVTAVKKNDDKIRIIIRSSKLIFSDYRQKDVRVRYILAFDVDHIDDLVEDEYYEPIDNVTNKKGKLRPRLVLKLDDHHWIWQWKGDGRSKEFSELATIHKRLKSIQDEPYDPVYSKIFTADSQDDSRIIPVIYQPAVDSLKNFVREVHCNKLDDNNIQVTLVFNDKLGSHEYLNKTYKLYRRMVYKRSSDLESFVIKLENGIPEKFQFPAIYSGDKGMDYTDHVHEDGPVNGNVPSRKIQYYFGNEKHPIVFINTANHAMSFQDANHRLWKWEYIPWAEDSPIILGEKSRSELEKSGGISESKLE